MAVRRLWPFDHNAGRQGALRVLRLPPHCHQQRGRGGRHHPPRPPQGELKAEGYECNCKVPGVHDPLDPEYSILKQRLARRARYEKLDTGKLDLVEITRLAERTISTDMDFLAEKVVDSSRANYAVITGVQIHNWATELTPEAGVPSLEFVAVAQCYVVVDGVKKFIDLRKVPPMSPRQLQLMARASITSPVVYDDDEVLISKTKIGE